jgi:hypothetical protein
LLDFQVGLFGQLSERVSLVQAALILFVSLLYAWWGVAFARAGSDGVRGRVAGLASLLVFAFIWSFLANGIGGVISCPPPCEGAGPYGDIAHFGNILFGSIATYATWWAMKGVWEQQADVLLWRPALSPLWQLLLSR